MRKGLITTLQTIWLVVIWFLSFVAHAIAFKEGCIEWLAILLGIFWLIYLAGLWLEQSRITDTAWAMLLGYAIGCIRMLDMIPNQQEYAHWLRLIPKSIIGVVTLAFTLIFVGVLPLIAKNIIDSHKAKKRVLGRYT
jgi:hypothetical protein